MWLEQDGQREKRRRQDWRDRGAQVISTLRAIGRVQVSLQVYEHTLKDYEQECDMTCSFIYFENISWKWIDERMELEGSNPKKK